MRISIFILMMLLSCVANAASVLEREGNIFYAGDDGVSTQLTSQHIDSNPLLSPDGQKVIFGRTTQEKAEYSEELERAIWLSDISGKEVRRILSTHHDEVPEKTLTQFNNWIFSADGKQLYFLTAAWAVSNAMHVLDLTSGKEHFVTDANDVLIIPKGKYANHLVVSKHKYFKREGSYDYYWLITPKGKEIKMVGKDKEQAERFIRKQGVKHK
jgi:dipeptidyl aminopeptidase/acylaminoacyl peptidase